MTSRDDNPAARQQQTTTTEAPTSGEGANRDPPCDLSLRTASAAMAPVQAQSGAPPSPHDQGRSTPKPTDKTKDEKTAKEPQPQPTDETKDEETAKEPQPQPTDETKDEETAKEPQPQPTDEAKDVKTAEEPQPQPTDEAKDVKTSEEPQPQPTDKTKDEKTAEAPKPQPTDEAKEEEKESDPPSSPVKDAPLLSEEQTPLDPVPVSFPKSSHTPTGVPAQPKHFSQPPPQAEGPPSTPTPPPPQTKQRTVSPTVQSRKTRLLSSETRIFVYKLPSLARGRSSGGGGEAEEQLLRDADDAFRGCIAVFPGGVTDLCTDAIVNAANAPLRGGGGVDGAVHAAAGHRWMQERLRPYKTRAEAEGRPPCPAGDAVLTDGAAAHNRLRARYVIHAVGPMGEHPEVLRRCYRSVFRYVGWPESEEQRRATQRLVEPDAATAFRDGSDERSYIETVAVCGISTGVYGYPVDRAYRVAVEEAARFLARQHLAAREAAEAEAGEGVRFRHRRLLVVFAAFSRTEGEACMAALRETRWADIYAEEKRHWKVGTAKDGAQKEKAAEGGEKAVKGTATNGPDDDDTDGGKKSHCCVA